MPSRGPTPAASRSQSPLPKAASPTGETASQLGKYIVTDVIAITILKPALTRGLLPHILQCLCSVIA